MSATGRYATRTIIAAAVLAGAFATAPARAGDDGQASLITGLASTFGLTKEDDPQIDFRERPKLVVPPKKMLPPPMAAAPHHDNAWPVDNETSKARKLKAMDDAEPSARQRAHGQWQLVRPGDEVKVTTSGFDHNGPACRRPDPKTGECPQQAGSSTDWNPLTWVGLQKKKATTLGPEPERETLIDPPKGYRAPAQGVGAKVAD